MNKILHDKLLAAIHKSLNEVLSNDFEYFADDYEDYPDELASVSKKVEKLSDMFFKVYYRFGKNGSGLSKELIAVGNDIYKYSQDYFVTIDSNNIHFDSLDDIYDMAIICQPYKEGAYIPKMRKKYINEGAWGYKPNNSDSYWDWTHVVTKDLKKELLKGLKHEHPDMKYVYMGLINGFLAAENIWEESLHSVMTDFYIAYKKAYESIKADEHFINEWSKPDTFRKELDNTFNKFKKILKDKFKYELPEIPKEYQEECNNKHIKQLKDGDYTAKWYAYFFELEDGKKYYTPSAPKCSRNKTAWKKYRVSDGNIYDPKDLMINVKEVKESIDYNPHECLAANDIPENIRNMVIGTIDELPEGIYKAKHWSCYFMLENRDKYYIDWGPRCHERQVNWELFDWRNGKLTTL